MMTPSSLLSCFRSRVHSGGCYRHPPAVSTDMRLLIIAAPSLFECWGMGWCTLPVVLTQDSRLHTQRACDQADFLNPTPHRMLHCSLQSRVMFCSVLHVVTQPPTISAQPHKHGDRREAEVCRQNWLQCCHYQLPSTGTLDSRQPPPPATWLQVQSDFLSPVSV